MAFQKDFVVGTNLSLSGTITKVNGKALTDGQLLIGSPTGFSVANLITANGVSVSNGNGSITLSLTNTGVAIGTYNSVTVDLTGRVTQALKASKFVGNISPTQGTTVISSTTTAPLVTAGSQLMSQVVTPALATSKMLIEFSGLVNTSASNTSIIVSAFRDSTFIGCTVVGGNISGLLASYQPTSSCSLRIVDSPGATTAVTYTIRIGLSASGTWYLGRTASSTFGGANPSGWSIIEILT